jgi:hypothetical protein
MSDYLWPVSVDMLEITDEFRINKVNYVVCTEPRVGRDVTKFSVARQVKPNEDAPTGWVIEDVKFHNSTLVKWKKI